MTSVSRRFSRIIDSWGTKVRFSVPAYLWFLLMLILLTVLDEKHLGFFLMPPFFATLSMLHLLPDDAISQPYAVIVGSVAGASVGTFFTLFGRGPTIAAMAAAAAFVTIHLLRAYHPPAVALALYPALFHPKATFPIYIVLPFTMLAVGSAAWFSRLSPNWPKYPLPLGKIPSQLPEHGG